MNPAQIIYSIVGFALVSAIGAYLWNCESVKKAQAQAVIVAEQARDKAEKEAKRLQGAKEKSDAQTQIDRARIADLSKRLRDARSSRGFLPPASPGAPSPDRITLDRAELERTLQRLDDGVSAIVAEGDQAITALDGAKAWAVAILPPTE